MADEATQETTTTIVEGTEPAVDNADQVVDTPVEATETAETVSDTDTGEEAPKERVYTQAEVKKYKDEAQKLRQRLKDDTASAAKKAAEESEKAIAERIGKALGLIPEENDKPVDPEKLLAQAIEREAQAVEREAKAAAKLRAYELEKALTKAADAVDGDLDILTPYLKGTGALDALDPDAEDFADLVSAVVASAVEANSKLKKTVRVAAPSRSGGDNTSGTGIPKKGPESVDDIRAGIRKKRGF